MGGNRPLRALAALALVSGLALVAPSAGRGLIQSVPPIGGSAAAVLSARLANRYGPSLVLSGAFVMIVVGFVVIANAGVVLMVPLGLLIIGLGFGTLFPLLAHFATSSAGDAHRGAAVSSWLASVRLGQTVGPVIGTVLVTSIGGRPL